MVANSLRHSMALSNNKALYIEISMEIIIKSEEWKNAILVKLKFN